LAAGGARDRRDVIDDAITAGRCHWLHCAAHESSRLKVAKVVRASENAFDDFFTARRHSRALQSAIPP